ncbi:MAG: hypothetical protein COZ87_02115, partial [Candidatus Moranbacteria bacterium CG_4_8_14_3_um_filter_43_15]
MFFKKFIFLFHQKFTAYHSHSATEWYFARAGWRKTDYIFPAIDVFGNTKDRDNNFIRATAYLN